MTVQMYRSTDRDAPVMTGQQGKMGDLLLEVLVRGYPRQTATGITRTGSTATCSKTAHGFMNGQTVSISGANEPEYNGNFVIFNVSTNAFDFTVTGTPATTATGTILVGGEVTVGTVTSVNRSGSTVTVVMPSHGMAVGNRFRLTGANEVQYNAIWTVATVVDANTLTFTLPTGVTPSTPATGTILMRYGVCGAGWTQPYSSTNRRNFRQGAKSGAIQAILRVNENQASYHTYGAGFMMAEDCTAIDTFVNPVYSTEGDGYTGLWKSNTADTTARPWVVVGDHRTFIVLTKPAITNSNDMDGWQHGYFGDILSYLPNDAYPQYCAPLYRYSSYSFNSLWSAAAYASSYSYGNEYGMQYSVTPSGSDSYMPCRMLRNHLGQVGSLYVSQMFAGSTIFHDYSYANSQVNFGAQFQGNIYDTYPDPVHGGINMGKVLIKHQTSAPATGNPVIRGEMRGIWNPYHRRIAGWLNNDTFEGSGALAGRTFEVFNLAINSSSWFVIEISDTWEA